MYKMALTNKRRVKFNSKWKQTVIILVFQIQFNLSLRTPLYYGQFQSFGLRNAKNHAFPTSIVRTPL